MVLMREGSAEPLGMEGVEHWGWWAACGSWDGRRDGVQRALPRQEGAHFAKDFRLPVNKTNVVGVGEYDGPAVGNLPAEMFDPPLVILPLCFHKFLRPFSLRLLLSRFSLDANDANIFQ